MRQELVRDDHAARGSVPFTGQIQRSSLRMEQLNDARQLGQTSISG
jgi:hypothetical protein